MPAAGENPYGELKPDAEASDTTAAPDAAASDTAAAPAEVPPPAPAQTNEIQSGPTDNKPPDSVNQPPAPNQNDSSSSSSSKKKKGKKKFPF